MSEELRAKKLALFEQVSEIKSRSEIDRSALIDPVKVVHEMREERDSVLEASVTFGNQSKRQLWSDTYTS